MVVEAAIERSGWAREYAVAVEAVREAAMAVREFYDAATAAVYTKDDESPVTDADLASDRLIREHLEAAFPNDALLTEEGLDDPGRLGSSRLWLADPLDGTQQFIDRTGAFDVFLALVVDGRPVVAVTGHPVSGTVLSAIAGAGAWVEDTDGKRPLRVPALDPAKTPRLSANRYQTLPQDWPLLLKVAERAGFVPPAAPKPFHPRAWYHLPGTTPEFEGFLGIGRGPNGAAVGGEWDLAAPDLILHEAGGRFTDEQGRTLIYNKDDAAIRHGIIAAIDAGLHQRLVDALAAERSLPFA
jgi:3'-phosphoadenosine 5'-phosphosulfate (PAPS) 3'-phosphatase